MKIFFPGNFFPAKYLKRLYIFIWVNIFLDYHLSIFTEAFAKIAILKFSINCKLSTRIILSFLIDFIACATFFMHKLSTHALLNNRLLQEQYYIHNFFCRRDITHLLLHYKFLIFSQYFLYYKINIIKCKPLSFPL